MKNRGKQYPFLANIFFFLAILIYFFEPSSRSIGSYVVLSFMGYTIAQKIYKRQHLDLKTVDELENRIQLEIYTLSYNSLLATVVIIGIIGFLFYHDSPVFKTLAIIYFFGVFFERVVETIIRRKYQ